MTRTQELIASSQANATETHTGTINVSKVLELLEAHKNEVERMVLAYRSNLAYDRNSSYWDGAYVASRNIELKFDEVYSNVFAELMVNMRAEPVEQPAGVGKAYDSFKPNIA